MAKKSGGIKRAFITGLAVLLPTIITMFILVLAFNFLSNNVAQPMGRGVVTMVTFIKGGDVTSIAVSPLVLSLIGFPLTIIIIFFIGYLTATFIGRTIFKGLETWVFSRFPIIRSVYPYAKQFSDLFLSDDKKSAFRMVVAVQYPRNGLYAIAFVTSEGLKDLNNATAKQLITVFIASSPTPFTGYTIFVPRDDVIKLSLTVDQAFRLLISGGVLIPPHQLAEFRKDELSPETSPK